MCSQKKSINWARHYTSTGHDSSGLLVYVTPSEAGDVGIARVGEAGGAVPPLDFHT